MNTHKPEPSPDKDSEFAACLIASFPALLAESNANDKLTAALHASANRVAGLFTAQYLRAHGDGGRVAHAMEQMRDALAAISANYSRSRLASLSATQTPAPAEK